jgi:hypothetical protein
MLTRPPLDAPPPRLVVVHGGPLSGPARREYLTWIRGRALRMYGIAGRALADDRAPGDPDAAELDGWISGAAFEAGEVFATDLSALPRRSLPVRLARRFARWLWALTD